MTELVKTAKGASVVVVVVVKMGKLNTHSIKNNTVRVQPGSPRLRCNHSGMPQSVLVSGDTEQTQLAMSLVCFRLG